MDNGKQAYAWIVGNRSIANVDKGMYVVICFNEYNILQLGIEVFFA